MLFFWHFCENLRWCTGRIFPTFRCSPMSNAREKSSNKNLYFLVNPWKRTMGRDMFILHLCQEIHSNDDWIILRWRHVYPIMSSLHFDSFLPWLAGFHNDRFVLSGLQIIALTSCTALVLAMQSCNIIAANQPTACANIYVCLTSFSEW